MHESLGRAGTVRCIARYAEAVRCMNRSGAPERLDALRDMREPSDA